MDDEVNGKGEMMGSPELQKLVGKFDKDAEKNKAKEVYYQLVSKMCFEKLPAIRIFFC